MYNEILREKIKRAFTLEERQRIELMVSKGLVKDIAAALDMNTPEEETVLQEMVDALVPKAAAGGSAARRELARLEAEGKDPIQSPEDEAMWQAKLDAEKAMLQPKDAAEAVAEAEAATGAEEAKADYKDLNRVELMSLLQARGIYYHSQSKKAAMVELLEKADADSANQAPTEEQSS
jgi:hypothetical protein